MMNRKIDAIKIVRARMNCGLNEAKLLIDEIGPMLITANSGQYGCDEPNLEQRQVLALESIARSLIQASERS